MNLASNDSNQSNPTVRRFYRRCSVTERTLRDVLPLVSSSATDNTATTTTDATSTTHLPRHAPDALDRVRIRPSHVVRNEKQHSSSTPSPSSVTHRTLREAASLLARISDDDEEDDELLRYFRNRALQQQHPLVVPPPPRQQLLLSIIDNNDNSLMVMTNPLLFRSPPSMNDCYIPPSTVAPAAATATIDNTENDDNIEINAESSHFDEPCLMMTMEGDALPCRDDSSLLCVDRKRPCINDNGDDYYQDTTMSARSPKQPRRE